MWHKHWSKPGKETNTCFDPVLICKCGNVINIASDGISLAIPSVPLGTKTFPILIGYFDRHFILAIQVVASSG